MIFDPFISLVRGNDEASASIPGDSELVAALQTWISRRFSLLWYPIMLQREGGQGTRHGLLSASIPIQVIRWNSSRSFGEAGRGTGENDGGDGRSLKAILLAAPLKMLEWRACGAPRLPYTVRRDPSPPLRRVLLGVSGPLTHALKRWEVSDCREVLA